MKLIEIKGNLWELSCLQSSYCDVRISSDEVNKGLLSGNDMMQRGTLRPLAKFGVRSTAKAIVEITVNSLPARNEYEIYLSSKGFFSKIQGSRVYLSDLLEGSEL